MLFCLEQNLHNGRAPLILGALAMTRARQLFILQFSVVETLKLMTGLELQEIDSWNHEPGNLCCRYGSGPTLTLIPDSILMV